MSNKKPESSRLNLFYILYVLSVCSDEHEPMSATEIATAVNREFGYLTDEGLILSKDTVKRTLDELTGTIFPEECKTLSILQKYGIFLHVLWKSNGSYVPYCADGGKQNRKKYYYLEHELKVAEIITLQDAIEAYCYFSEEDTTGIIRKLLRFAPHKMREKTYFDNARDERNKNSKLLRNIDCLSKIIKEHKGARITYCSYNIDKELVPREGYPKVVEPVDMMWSNGFYYLLAYSDKYEEIMNMRIDRITEIEEAELENRHDENNYNPVRYRYEHPVMFTGPQGQVKLLCRNKKNNYMMNILVDAFGKNARIHKASKEMVERYLGKSPEEYEKEGYTWLEVVVNSSLWGIELWALQYCNDCRLISPEESVNRVKQRLQTAIDLYQ